MPTPLDPPRPPDAGDKPKKREIAKQETREALITAGLAAFADQGLDTPSLDAICARADLTRGAFYVHFRNREELLVAVMDRVMGAFLDTVVATESAAGNLADTIRRFALGAEAIQAGNSEVAGFPPFTLGLAFHRLLDACARSDVVRRRFVELIQEANTRVADAVRRDQGTGAVPAGLDPEAIASLLSLTALGVVTSLESGIPLDVDAVRAIVERILLGGTETR